MKNFKTLIFALVAIIAIFSLTTCKRATVDAPSMTVNSGFRIILSGTAEPSTLFVPDDNTQFSTTVSLKAVDNKGVPLSGYQVILEQVGSVFGYFDNDILNTIADKRTDSNGIVTAEYIFPAAIYVPETRFAEVKATFVDDGRLDPQNMSSAITDTIPIKIIVKTNTYSQMLRLHGRITPTNYGSSVAGVIITAAGNGLYTDELTAVTRSSGSWEIMVPMGWTGVITPSNQANDTFIPANRTYATPLTSSLDGIDFILDTVAAANNITADITTYSATNILTGPITVSVYSSSPASGSLTYSIASSSSWLTTSAANGITPGVFTFTCSANATGAQRIGIITISATNGTTHTITVTQAL